MQAQLIPISLYLITTFIYLTSSVDPTRNPSLEQNVLRGLEVASKLNFNPMGLVRVWNTVDNLRSPSSDLGDFKSMELEINFTDYRLQPLLGYLQGGQGSNWGSWPYRYPQLWAFEPEKDPSFDFVLEVSVPQVLAANLANRAGDMGPWVWILLCVPGELNITEPTWFFMPTKGQFVTAVGATTERVRRYVRATKICLGLHPPGRTQDASYSDLRVA